MKDSFLLDPGVVYLNHGSFGACPRPVFEAYQQWQRELERQPVEFLALERRFPRCSTTARREARRVRRRGTDNLAFVPNATTRPERGRRGRWSSAAATRCCSATPSTAGWSGSGSSSRRRTGAHVERRPFDELDPGPRTRVVFCSHIEWSTGRVNDLARLVARTRARRRAARRRRRARAGPDRPRSRRARRRRLRRQLPQMAVRAEGLGLPLRAARGAAADRSRDRVVGLARRRGFPELHRWQGTRDPSAYLAVPAAIAFQAEHDWPSVRERCHELLASLELPFPRSPTSTYRCAASASTIPTRPASSGGCTSEHRIEVPVVETPAGWVMRVSVQAYNDEADLAAAQPRD